MSDHSLDPIDLDRPRNDSRRLWMLLGVLVLVVPPALLAFYYEPLQAASEGAFTQATDCPEGATAAPAADGAGEVCLLPHQPGATFIHSVPVANTGRFGIRVAGADFTEGGLLAVAGAHVEQEALPAKIEGGQVRAVTISTRMLECTDQSGNQLYTYTELPVTQSFGPIRKEIRLPLDPPIALDVTDCE